MWRKANPGALPSSEGGFENRSSKKAQILGGIGSVEIQASNDRAVPPELEKAEAAAMKATSITVPSSHVPMLSHPKEVADLIEQAAVKAGSLTNGTVTETSRSAQ